MLFPEVEDYDPKRPMNRRSLESCTSRICFISNLKLQEAVKLKKKFGRPCANPEDKHSDRLKVCGKCFSVLYRGCNHSPQMCSSRREKVYNLERLIDSPVTKQRLASRTINKSPQLSTLGSRPQNIKLSSSSNEKMIKFHVKI